MTNVVKLERDWYDLLHKGREGPRPILANVTIALRGAAEWKDKLFYDVFAQRIACQGIMPWSEGEEVSEVWTDAHDTMAAEWMQNVGIFVTTPVVSEAVKAVARERRYHPVRDYLDSLVWEPNTEPSLTWLSDYLGVEKTAYSMAVAQCWLISAVARIYQPGCKVDTAMILEGAQGIKKSSALKVLGGEWFTDEISDFGTRDASMQMAGVWIIELAELDNLSKSEISRTKAFMSRSVDRYVKKWGRHAFEQPRECVFAGTVNHSDFLKDETGGRRFWPIKCGDKINIAGLTKARDQLWADAVRLYHQDRPWWLPSFVSDDAKREQSDRYQHDAWESIIEQFLGTSRTTSMEEILGACLQMQKKDFGQAEQNRVARCLKILGWAKRRVSTLEGRKWAYVKSDSEIPCPTLEEVIWRDKAHRDDFE